jgi:hypothetical protein
MREERESRLKGVDGLGLLDSRCRWIQGRFGQARLANQVLPAQLVKRNRRLLTRPVRLFSEVCIYPSRLDAPANNNVALHIDIAYCMC